VTQAPFPGAGLGDTANQVLRILGQHLHTRRFRKGTLLWREGETSGLLVAIRTGRVKIYRLLPTGKAVTVFLFGPGDVFGFLPFLDGGAYPAYAQAIEDVEAEVLPRSVLLRALRADPDLALGLIGLLGQRLRAAMALLALLAEEQPTAPTMLRLPVTAQEFAGAIGIAPETLSRELRRLEDIGVLAREGSGRYRVLSLQGLEQAAATTSLD
jgi:CRP-like cAMP-binding protein